MAETIDLLDRAQTALAAARALGAEAGDAHVSERASLSVSVRLGALEHVERQESAAIGLRVLVGKHQAGAASSDVSPAGLRTLAERVVAMAKAAPEDPYCGLPDPGLLARDWPDLGLYDAHEPDAAALEQLSLEAEDAARAIAGVTNSNGAGADWGASRYAYAATNGFAGAYRASSVSVGLSVVAERDGAMERDYEGRAARRIDLLPAMGEIGRIAGERTVARLGARKIASRRAAVLYDRRVAGSLLSAFLGAISGAAVARGVSFLKDKLAAPVFAPDVHVIDDPLRRGGFGARPFDGEGVAAVPRALIDGGRLTTWLLNSAAARQLGLASTGHAAGAMGGPPGVTASDVHLAAGPESPRTLLAAVPCALVVQETFSPSINPNTGDYSVGVAGQWVEGGEIIHPVSEVTVAGNLIDIFARLRPAADLEFRGAVNAPSLFVEDLAIAGT